MCHADQHWTEALPLVHLGIRTSFKADLQASVAELVYREPLRIPGELLTPIANPVEPAHPITQLSQKDKTLKLLVHGKPFTVSVDRVKPAYIFNEDDSGATTFNPATTATPTTTPSEIAPPPSMTKTARSGRHVRFPVRFTS
jgi:hypothetical protein